MREKMNDIQGKIYFHHVITCRKPIEGHDQTIAIKLRSCKVTFKTCLQEVSSRNETLRSYLEN